MKCIDLPSPNFNDRREGTSLDYIVIHYTSMDSTKAALDRLTDPKSEVSAHYLIDEKGNIYTLVDEEKRAWHAGISSWMGKDDLNSRSIGIEMSNRDNQPYTNEQLFSLALLCKDIMFRRGIAPENILGHSDIAPDRKQDPGYHFPWAKMARHDIGRWPKPTIKDKFNAAAVARSPRQLKELFKAAGYGVEAHGKNKPALKDIINAFQQRYEPELFKDPTATPGKATADTVAKLRALARINQNPAKKPK